VLDSSVGSGPIPAIIVPA